MQSASQKAAARAGRTAGNYRSRVDRKGIARRQRRRQVEELLEEERGREEAVAQRLEEVVAESEGPRIDEGVFARMDPVDAALVREMLAEPSPFDEADDEAMSAAEEPVDLQAAELDEEIARLQAEIVDAQRRQLAYRRYLEALDV